MKTRVIRKIWIGKTIKEDSMSWHVGQTVRLGREGGTGIVDHILETKDGYEIFVKKESTIVAWKKTSMDSTVEYDIVF